MVQSLLVRAGSPYGIEHHSHLFAAWAASRASSVKGCRFSVAQGREILERCGFVVSFSSPDNLPEPSEIDAQHRDWRERAINAANAMDLPFTHGIAAKIINCYLKSRFVCAGHHADARVAALHPPIDRLLLNELGQRDFGGLSKVWKRASASGWSNFNSNQYEELIMSIRNHLFGKPLWMIEEHWRGNQ